LDGRNLALTADALEPGRLGTGDYFAILAAGRRLRIAANTSGSIEFERPPAESDIPPPGSLLPIQIRLQQPYVDPARCIGCGVCEHECPVLGLRAIRVTAENESRSPSHRMVL
jgi:ferredoxin